MTPHPTIIDPDSTLKDAAQIMEEIGCGVLPVGRDDELAGILTDRDIVVRAVAQGKDINAEKIKDYMTANVRYCNENDTLEFAANLMRDYRVTRLVVRNDEGQVSGIISFGCILRKDNNAEEVSNVVDYAVGRKQVA